MERNELVVTRRQMLLLLAAQAVNPKLTLSADELQRIPPQPYFANVKRALEVLASLGAPIDSKDAERMAALARDGDAAAVEAAEALLNRYTLAKLLIHPNNSLSIDFGGAPRVLVEQGWRMFLVRVSNMSGKAYSISFPAQMETPSQMAPNFDAAQRPPLVDTLNKARSIERMWLLARMHGASSAPSDYGQPTTPVIPLTGFTTEYHVVQLFSRDRGARSADLGLFIPLDQNAWPASASKTFDFDCLPTRDVKLDVRDTDGRGCVASLTIRDAHAHVYPPQAMRLAPDMFFHPQIYRADGETVRLPDAEYTIESTRGPEYLKRVEKINIGAAGDRIEVQLKRWIDPSRWGWYSGDTHIHAAGCMHYTVPTEGVAPETMIRHVRGEGLSIGEVLTWGPGWAYQKQFFKGQAQSPAATLEYPQLQTANNVQWVPRATPKDNESLLRYDVEVSGFPSSMCGHLVLLRLRQQEYPGTQFIDDWPSWNLPILKWAKAQGAVVGYAHCALGMDVPTDELPNYEIPRFDSIGTNEAIVDVTHGLTDFLSGGIFSPAAELNAWYHLLNCGFRVAFVGETDYPCITGERPGVGRTYVRLSRRPIDDTGYEEWVEGIQKGLIYIGDGRSHFLDFQVQGRHSGEELSLSAPDTVDVEAELAAWLNPMPTPPDSNTMGLGSAIRWHLEHARIGNSREVWVELIVNGIPVAKTAIVADGAPRRISFTTAVTRSSWLALRILTSAHTHPVFVQIAGNPIRASKRSAQWCRTCVDKLWEVKSPLIRASERPAAVEAFDHARNTYDKLIDECEIT